ncbi:hypothetical protein BJ166DRAFT_500359 [Pestalotiopsis sp. NC0098]|nr:hypothetical protein BJ166DRAFT_500359 [Pestalotiopsis sp. NC0098]
MRFQAPQLGALGVTFTALRAAQLLSLLTIIGLVANFINEIVSVQRDAPDVLIGTLVVASTASLYIAISYILYYDGLLPLLVAGVCDFLLLIATIVVATTVGKPLSKLTCETLPLAGTSTIASGSQVFVASSSGVTYRSVLKKVVDYYTYVAVDQPHCYEIKAVWGLSISLCVLFAFSAVVLIGLWRRTKSVAAAPKDIEVYEEKGASFQVIQPPPHQDNGDGRITGPLALSSRSLGTGVLHQGPAAAARQPTFVVPPPSAPTHPAPQAAPVLNFRGIDEDITDVPPPPPMIYVNRPASRGRSLTAQRRSAAMPAILESPDSIPARHKRIPEKIRTQNLDVLVPPPTPSDDGFTPVNTPGAPLSAYLSPKSAKTKMPRSPISPRDALGIPISKIKAFARSMSPKTASFVEDDLEPLSPSAARDADGLPVPVQAREKPKRKTVWGIIDGWWDLNLLDRE